MNAVTTVTHCVTTIQAANHVVGGGSIYDNKLLIGLFPLLVPAAIAWWQFVRNRSDRRRTLRSSYLAQLHSLSDTVRRELSFIEDSLMAYTWFPILPYLREGEGALSSAGLLSADEVRAVLQADFVYRERTTYIAKYGNLVLGEGGLASAIGVNISQNKNRSRKKIYKIDLGEVDEAVSNAIRVLEKAESNDTKKLWRP